MKTILKILTFCLFCLFISSCITGRGTIMTISGVPGTEIYKPDMTKIAVINNDGTTKIKFKGKNNYYPFLLSRNPANDMYIPFAIDYKEKKYIGNYIAYSVGTVGSIMVLEGIVFAACGMPEVGLGMLGGGLAGSLAFLFGPNFNSFEVLNSIKYLSKQRTNEDLNFAEYVDKGYKKVLSSNKSTDTAQKTSTTETGDIPEKQDKAVSSSYTKSAFTLKNNAEKIIGQYNGQGVLMQSGIEVENFNKVTVFIENTNRKNVVSVKIIVGDGIDFFNSDCYYQVKKTASGFSLIMQDMPEATIEIDKENGLHYKHPKVNIDGEIMMLDIKASFNK